MTTQIKAVTPATVLHRLLSRDLVIFKKIGSHGQPGGLLWRVYVHDRIKAGGRYVRHPQHAEFSAFAQDADYVSLSGLAVREYGHAVIDNAEKLQSRHPDNIYQALKSSITVNDIDPDKTNYPAPKE